MTRHRTALLFFALAVAWGSAFVAIDAGLVHLPPVLFAAVRYDVAAILMLAYAAYAVEDSIPRGRAAWLEVAVGATLLIAAYHAFLFVGQQYTTAAAAAVIVSLSPVLTTGFARALVPQDALSPVGVVGLLVGLVGVGVMSQPDPSNLLATGTVANGLIFLAAASFALGSVTTRRIDADLPIETMEAWSMAGGAVVLHAASLARGEPVEPAAWLRLEALGAVAFLAVISSAIGFLLYFELLDRLGAVEINMVTYAATIVAAIVGWLYLGQAIDLPTAVGFTCILAGFVMVKRRAIRRKFASTRTTD